jgi:hypothetical protein
MRKLNGAISRVEILNSNVGYMRVNGVPVIENERSAWRRRSHSYTTL